MRRIGIFSGVFDPVHDGHIQFALAAAKQAKLDEVYFLLEVKPRRKTGVTHLAHRLAMIILTIAKQPNLNLLDLPDRQLMVAKTLPRLKQKFKNDELFYLIGADMLEHLPDWPLVDKLLESMTLIIGLRQNDSQAEVDKVMAQLPANDYIVLKSPKPKISSAAIRQALMAGKQAPGLNSAVLKYIKANWLYVSVWFWSNNS